MICPGQRSGLSRNSATAKAMINQAGTYTYFCLFHDGMTGTITVIE